MFKTTCKLIFRNWWRNKTFTLISMVSLTVGIAFFNLLSSFTRYLNFLSQKRGINLLKTFPTRGI